MIDIHSHILPGIDDGSKTIEESIEILKQAEQNGVTDIILTPHYMLGSEYVVNNEDKRKLLTKLKRYVKKEGLNVNLYLGNEVFVENDMPRLKQEKEIATLNNSNYLLFELPLNYRYNGVDEVLFELGCKGYVPVLAHPERYGFIKEDPRRIEDLIDKGAIIQCNMGSFLGKYGRHAKDTAILFLKHHMISFVASDIHHTRNKFYEEIEEVKEVMRKYVSEEEIDNLFTNNAKKILDKEIVSSDKYKPIKKGIFRKWK